MKVSLKRIHAEIEIGKLLSQGWLHQSSGQRTNFYIGSIANRLGFKIVRNYQYPVSKLSLLHLAVKAISKPNKSLCVVQIGAFDGKTADPLQDVIRNNENKFVLVEPQLAPFRKLEKLYENQPNVVLENSAISGCDGEVDLFLPSNEEFSPKASLAASHLKNFGYSSNIKSIKVNGITFRSLLSKHAIQNLDVYKSTQRASTSKF